MAQNYEKILNNPEVIKWSKQHLKKRNRIEWYLKKIKAQPTLHPQEFLAHFYAMEIAAIETFPLEDLMTFNALRVEFLRIERRYLNNLNTNKKAIAFTGEEDILLSLDSDFYWVNLNKPSCPEEGSFLGHCGNRGGSAGDRVLSLRQKVKKVGRFFWEPHLTFVIDERGYLGEMKGKQNAKPHLKYHPQILPLFSCSIIRGVKGGNYLSENNFHFSDMSAENIEFVLKNYSEKLSTPQLQFLKQYQSINFLLNCTLEKEDWGHNLWWVNSQEVLSCLSENAKSPSIAMAAAKKLTDYSLIKRSVEKTLVKSEHLSMGLISGSVGEVAYSWFLDGRKFSQTEYLELYKIGAEKRNHYFCQRFENNHVFKTKEMMIEALKICAEAFPYSAGSSLFFRTLSECSQNPVLFLLETMRTYPQTKNYFFKKIVSSSSKLLESLELMNQFELDDLTAYVEKPDTVLIIVNSTFVSLGYKKNLIRNVFDPKKNKEIFESTVRTFSLVVNRSEKELSIATESLRQESLSTLNDWEQCLAHPEISAVLNKRSFLTNNSPILEISKKIELARKELKLLEELVSGKHDKYYHPDSFWLKAREDNRGARLY